MRASPGVPAPPKSILKRRSSIRPVLQECAVHQDGQENTGVEARADRALQSEYCVSPLLQLAN